ncbi:hypothetical protein ACHAP8_009723 [Fusarium lateritium]
MYWRNPGAFKNGFKGFCSVLVTSAFSFTGTELIGLAAAETANPRKSLPTAIKQVFWRIMIFYLVALLLVGLLVPSDDKRLVGGDNVADATASPFVIAIEKAGTSLLPGIMNAIILIAVISVGNSAVFGSSRTLAALAEQSHAPQIFAYVDRQGRPLMAILFASCIGVLAFLADVNSHDAIFNWLLSISALSTLFTWGSICLCYIRFRTAWSYNAHTIEQLPFKSHVGITGAWIALIGYILVLGSQIWIAASPVYAPDTDDGPSGVAQNFFLKVLAIPIIMLFYIFHKVWYRTQIVRLEEMDVETGRRYFRSSPLSFEQCYNAILVQPLAGQIISFINPFIPLRWLPVSANLDFIRAKSALKTMMEGLIEQRRAEVAAAKQQEGGGSLSDDLLTRMIEASAGESKRLSKEELIDIVRSVIAAGHETTASTLVWTAYALAKDTASQNRLRTEIHSLGTEISAKETDELPFLDNVIRESLRVYSPSLMIPWEAQKGITIAGVYIPKGTTVQIIPAMIQLNPEIWGNDADVFRPERWENMDSNASSPYAMEAFSNGPRICPGKALAMLNTKVLLLGLIRDFEMELYDDERDVEFRNPSLTLKAKKPIRFKIRRVS